MNIEQMTLRNNRLDALFYKMQGFSTGWIAARFNVHPVTAGRWVREAKRDPKLVAFCIKRLKASEDRMNADFGEGEGGNK